MSRYYLPPRGFGGYPGYGRDFGRRGSGRRRLVYGPLSSGFHFSGGAVARRHRDRPSGRGREERYNERTDGRERVSEEEAKKATTLTVSNLDLHVDYNTENHCTDEYACTQTDPKVLVLRRAQEFTFTLTFNRTFNKEDDELFFIFSPDDDPSRPINEQGPLDEVLQLDESWTDRFPPDYPEWGIRIGQQYKKMMEVHVHVPGNCIVGEWDLRIRTRLRAKPWERWEDGADWEYDHPECLVVLFNPWCYVDQVYKKEHLTEYVLNEDGLVFRGGDGTPWFYGQFNENVLAICLHVLRKAFQFNMTKDMADAVLVSRALSRIVNSEDDAGVLKGKWSGNYANGTRPTAWDSSVEILRAFYEFPRRPVKYGQCWVFSHVLTAVCRALGLPTRSVTNFDSAHDTDGSCTIDYYYNEDGDILKDRRQDSIWNFHVWNEVWMRRHDLSGDYDGWQVIDATPQEPSKGFYQCGPCPVTAVKNGQVDVAFDTRFVFAEVNADVYHWTRKRGTGKFKVSEIDTEEVGERITTKRPWDPVTDESSWGPMDITHLYKDPEGSYGERAAAEKAVLKDLKVRFEKDDGTLVGKDLEMILLVKNVSRGLCTVDVSMTACATDYCSDFANPRPLPTQKYLSKSIRPGEVLKFRQVVTFSQYSAVCDDLWSIVGSAVVKELRTDTDYAARRPVSLKMPPLNVKGPEKALPRQPVTVTITITNPLPIPLTDCCLHMDGSLHVAPDDPHPWSIQNGAPRLPIRRESGVKPAEKLVETVRLMGIRPFRGSRWRSTRSMVMTFECQQLGALKGNYRLTLQ